MRASWFTARRQKEDFAFLVVRFLRAYARFEEICRDYRAIEEQEQSFAGAGLFSRVRDLEEQIVFDIKEKAHALFRREDREVREDRQPREDREMRGDRQAQEDRQPRGQGEGARGGSSAGGFWELERALLSRSAQEGLHEDTRGMFQALRKSLVSRSLDAYIGTGFHMFMILRESLYQLESYAPKYAQEMEQVERIGYLTQRMGYDLDADEEHELGHIRQVAELCQGIAGDTRELASIALDRCRVLFRETAEVIRHSIEEAGDNEVLVLNLLREGDLVDAVYGTGAGEEILAHMFRSVQGTGASGRDRALAFARGNCGNVEGI